MTVLTTAWRAAGSPARSDIAIAGICARCGSPAELTPARAVISKTFTGFGGWIDPSGHGLCPACCWGYDTDALRLSPHLVEADPPHLTRLTKTQTGELLQQGCLGSGQALVVPLRAGRKHLVPTAAWGRVTTDNTQLPWGDSDARRLRIVARLRGLGFGTRMLAAPAPAYPTLRRLPATDWPQVISWWGELDPWRVADSPWLALALHVTTPLTTKEHTS